MRGLARVLGLVCASGAFAEAVEWERTPIAVTLAVGVERQIRFEGPATVGVPATLLEAGALRAEFAGDTAYWLAHEPFEEQRFKVRLERTGEFVLFDVRAVSDSGGLEEPINVRVARPREDAAAASLEGAADDPRGAAVALIRHAARLDLAPPRLATLPPGAVPIETVVADATALYRHADRRRVRFAVRRQWSRAGLFVTTLEAENVSPEPVELDVRRLRAGPRAGGGGASEFVAIGWTRSTLAAAGQPGFTARLYVVAHQPFRVADEMP